MLWYRHLNEHKWARQHFIGGLSKVMNIQLISVMFVVFCRDQFMWSITLIIKIELECHNSMVTCVRLLQSFSLPKPAPSLSTASLHSLLSSMSTSPNANQQLMSRIIKPTYILSSFDNLLHSDIHHKTQEKICRFFSFIATYLSLFYYFWMMKFRLWFWFWLPAVSLQNGHYRCWNVGLLQKQ